MANMFWRMYPVVLMGTLLLVKKIDNFEENGGWFGEMNLMARPRGPIQTLTSHKCCNVINIR
jgi:hypothetical protein